MNTPLCLYISSEILHTQFVDFVKRGVLIHEITRRRKTTIIIIIIIIYRVNTVLPSSCS